MPTDDVDDAVGDAVDDDGGMTETMRTMMITSTIDRWGGMIEHMRMIIRLFCLRIHWAMQLSFCAQAGMSETCKRCCTPCRISP